MVINIQATYGIHVKNNFLILEMVKFWLKTTEICLLLLLIGVYEIESSGDHSNITRVFGGYHVNITAVPYVVLIFARVIEDRVEGKAKCTGSIIAKEWVLTAAHCVRSPPIDQIKIFAGIDDMEKQTGMQIRVPTRIVYHPKCRIDGLLKWDLALLEVQEFDMSTSNVGLLELGGDTWPQDASMYKRDCKIIGWGVTEFSETGNQLMAAAIFAEHGTQSCKCLRRKQKISAICLKRESGRGSCSGDSGGPLTCNGKGYGVSHAMYDISACSFISRPVACGQQSTVGVYTFLCPELDWVHQYVPSVPKKPESCSAPKVGSLSPGLFICSILFRWLLL